MKKNTMKTKQILVWAAIVVSLGCAVASRGATFSNFEPLTYTNGTSLIGVDGWTFTLGGPTARVTPDPLGSGYLNVLEGSQSLLLAGGFLGRGWNGLENWVVTNGFYVSFLLQRPDGHGPTAVYLSDNLAGGATQAGIELDGAGSINVFGDTGTSNTGSSYLAGKTYRMAMLFSFNADTFTAFSENITDAGSVLNLGTYGIAGSPLDMTNLRNNGGLFFQTGLGVTIFDSIQVIPEPTTAGLAVLGGLLLLRGIRSRRK